AETRKVAEANPDFVFEGDCQYVQDGKPACLIGHALWNLGLIDADLESRSYNDDGVDMIKQRLNIDIDDDEEIWLAEAQSAQNRRRPWGEDIQLFANEQCG